MQAGSACLGLVLVSGAAREGCSSAARARTPLAGRKRRRVEGAWGGGGRLRRSAPGGRVQ
eukprot:420470-Rhodomonas_salina.1